MLLTGRAIRIGVYLAIVFLGRGLGPQDGDSKDTDTNPKGWILGVTGSSPERPVGEVKIEVRRSLAAIATWEWWRGAPLPAIQSIPGLSDKQGRFRIPVEPGYEYEVAFSKPGYKASKSLVYTNRPFLGLVQKGASDPVPSASTPSADRSMVLRGKVSVKASGKPIDHAGIREFWGTKWLTRSGKSGGFELRCTREQAENDLLVWAEGYRIASLPQSAFGKEAGVEVQLHPAVLLKGRLVDAKGKGLAGREVVVSTDVPVGEVTYGDVALWTKTDAEGRYSFSALGPGWRYWVRTLMPEGIPLELGEGILAEGPRDLGSTMATIGYAVTGQVMGPDRKPLDGGRVHVLRLFGGKPTQCQILRTTPSFPIDGQGRYRIPGLAPYAHELCFVREGLEPVVRVVKPPEQDDRVELDVRMGFGRSLRGLVVDADGKPVDGALVRGMVAADSEFFPLVPRGDMSHPGRFIMGNMRVLTRPDGSFLLERLRSRLPLRILCSKAGHKTVKLTLPATPDDKPLRITLH